MGCTSSKVRAIDIKTDEEPSETNGAKGKLIRQIYQQNNIYNIVQQSSAKYISLFTAFKINYILKTSHLNTPKKA